jgi:hypothetical protein
MIFDFEDANKSLKSYLKAIFLYTIGIICVFGFEPWASDILRIKNRSIFENILSWLIPFAIYGGLLHLMKGIKQENYFVIQILGTMIGMFVLFVIIFILKFLGGN